MSVLSPSTTELILYDRIMVPSSRSPISDPDWEPETHVNARRRWDLNPRLLSQHTISNRADSAALARLLDCSPLRLAESTPQQVKRLLLRIHRSCPGRGGRVLRDGRS